MSIEQKGLHLIQEAYKRDASDIHFHPKDQFVLIQFRINGQLTEKSQLHLAEYDRLLSHFKFQANMDIGEKRRPQNGSILLTLQNKRLAIRLSTIPTPFSESLALRLLPQNDKTLLHELFLFPESVEQLSSLLNESSGLCLLTGATGTGKTTTIYALLHELANVQNRRVITIEDPIEKSNDALIQMEINERAGITFSEGFKACLRHDPDVIMIGEIRDDITAKITIKAALSGHFVITTMHAKNTIGALYRLLEFGIPLVDIYQTVIAIATQKLINTKCPTCQQYCQPTCQYYRKQRRLALLELLANHPLKEAITHLESPNHSLPPYTTLSDEMKRAIQSGYVSKEQSEQWIGVS